MVNHELKAVGQQALQHESCFSLRRTWWNLGDNVIAVPIEPGWAALLVAGVLQTKCDRDQVCHSSLTQEIPALAKETTGECGVIAWRTRVNVGDFEAGRSGRCS